MGRRYGFEQAHLTGSWVNYLKWVNNPHGAGMMNSAGHGRQDGAEFPVGRSPGYSLNQDNKFPLDHLSQFTQMLTPFAKMRG